MFNEGLFLNFCLVSFGYTRSLLLCYFSSCCEQGTALLLAVLGFPIAEAALVEHSLSDT